MQPSFGTRKAANDDLQAEVCLGTQLRRGCQTRAKGGMEVPGASVPGVSGSFMSFQLEFDRRVPRGTGGLVFLLPLTFT